MDLVTILAAAAEESHNETPFLVVGGLLAAFGVLSGVLGIVRPNLPDGLANALMGIGAVLVVGTMISVIAT
jgi:fructose-specific phosphotransferase system IIC component